MGEPHEKKILILTFIGILVLTINGEASDKKIKVLLTIPPAVERALAGETRSYITRELRALQDVEQIEKDPTLDHYFISVFPISLNLSNGQSTGVAISYVIEKNSDMEHNVLVGPSNELKIMCEKIVAYFDTYWLQRERKK